MIKVLGLRRITILAILLGLNALLASINYFYVAPETEARAAQVKTQEGKIRTLQSDIGRLQVEFTQINDQRAAFEKLKKKGFFSDQDRSLASQLLQSLQRSSNVISAVADVKPGTLIDDEEAKKANHKLLASPMTIDITALDDQDVYRYFYLMRENFPGYITLNTIDIRRAQTLNGTLLRSVAAGENPVLVNAKFELLWQTMIPETQAIQAPKK